MKEFRLKTETIKRLSSNKRSTEREKMQADLDYLKQFEKGDTKQQAFKQSYNERFFEGLVKVDSELHHINEKEYHRFKRHMPLYPGGQHRLKQSLGLMINKHRAKISTGSIAHNPIPLLNLEAEKHNHYFS